MLLVQPQPSQAARGGRIGGGSFRAPTSIPRTRGYGGGSYRGGYGGYGGGYRRGGIGFPFILPIFGFGGGGLFGFLILMAIAGTIVNSIRGGLNNPSIGTSNGVVERSPGSVTMIQIQLGLLATAKQLQEGLRNLALTADTASSNGLQKVLQETTLCLLRQPDLWVYSNLETGEVPFASAESTFNRLSMTERSKLKSEITSNVFGQLSSSNTATIASGEADETNEYIAVTLLVASSKRVNLNQTSSSELLRENLQILGAIPSTDLIALEVIWQPEGQGDVLSAEELVTAYPNLKHL